MANNEQPMCKKQLRGVARAFLYSYACLMCYESDFHVANEPHLLPRLGNDATIPWIAWKAASLGDSCEP